MILEFGIYKGKDIRDVPREYIDWCINAMKQRLAEFEQALEPPNRDMLAIAHMADELSMQRYGVKASETKYNFDLLAEALHIWDNDNLTPVCTCCPVHCPKEGHDE